MYNSVRDKTDRGPDEFFRMLCFLLFSTAGMAAIALALWADPWAQYCHYQDLIGAQQRRIAKLQQLHDQQAELLANAENPAVVERAAINHLNYVPVSVNPDTAAELPPVWQDLQMALSSLERRSGEFAFRRRQQLITDLAEKTTHQNILLILGSALVVLSMSCFYRHPEQQ